MCSVGIVGNLLVVIITSCNRKSRTAVNYYILNLAIADLGILAICYPFTLVKTEDPLHWPLGSFICKIIYPMSDIFYGVSIGSIVAIAIDRYKAIVRSMHAQKTLRAAKWVILFIWMFAFVDIVFPLFFVMEFAVDIRGNGTIDCTPFWPNIQVTFPLYIFSLSFFWYVLPLAIILWTYREIARKIRASKTLHKDMRNLVGKYSGDRKCKRHDDQNTKALKILIPVVLAFSGTMLPFHVFRMVSVFVDVNAFEYIWAIYNVCTLLLLANSSINPIIYSLVSEDFRRRFKHVLCLQWNRLHDNVTTRRTISSRATTPPSYNTNELTNGRKKMINK
ncbi:hypothetical protein QZH41_002359 [Actinostola sp. cb2023]|nr:hypothetical protein QZH41_002359 [Actinostola sp. cb2023]